jgi:hypothetical protein
MTNNSGRWLPQNLDGSPHRCLPEDRYKQDNENRSSSSGLSVEAGSISEQNQPLTLEQMQIMLKELDFRLRRTEKVLFQGAK